MLLYSILTFADRLIWAAFPSFFLWILQAGEEGYVEAHIIFTGGMVGPVLAGSTFLKLLIQLATVRQCACCFGENTNMLCLVRQTHS